MTTKSVRTAALRELLLDRRSELQSDVSGRVKSSRTTKDREVGDTLDTSDADIQSGMEFRRLQMKTEMLTSIGHALRRIDAGSYGVCAECEEDISEQRLRAIPFAVRCQSCERRHEGAVRRGQDGPTARFEPEALTAPGWRS